MEIVAKTLGTELYVTGHALSDFENLANVVTLNHVLHRVLDMTRSGELGVLRIFPGDEAESEFLRLTTRRPGYWPIGDGEAAALAIVQTSGQGTVASNNLKDVRIYCESRGIDLICSDDILSLAVVRSICDLTEASTLWAQMKRRSELPQYDFIEALRRFENGIDR